MSSRPVQARVGLVLAAVVALLPAGAAHAQPGYPPQPGPVVVAQVDPPVVQAGGSVTLSAEGFAPHQEVRWTAEDHPARTVRADESGAVSVRWSPRAAGRLVVVATGEGPQRTVRAARAEVQVVPSGRTTLGARAAGLPAAGTDVWPGLAVGFLVVLIGAGVGLAVRLARRPLR